MGGKEKTYLASLQGGYLCPGSGHRARDVRKEVILIGASFP
jgi:hypothetical protein